MINNEDKEIFSKEVDVCDKCYAHADELPAYCISTDKQAHDNCGGLIHRVIGYTAHEFYAMSLQEQTQQILWLKQHVFAQKGIGVDKMKEIFA